jgi:hypothetical protein
MHMATGDPKPLEPPVAGANRVISFLTEWGRVISLLAGIIASLLVYFLGEATAKAVSGPIAIVLAVVAGFFWRQTRKRQEKQEREKERQAPAGSTAFRGPLSFHKGEQLPGAARRMEAQAAVLAISQEDFRFGVVTGELGCGKTSFLDAGLRAGLEKEEDKTFKVLFVASPRQLWPGENAPGGPPTTKAQSFTEGVRQGLKKLTRPAKAVRVLLVDQFEELFADVKAPADRQEVTRLFEELTAEGVRVVLGVRRDYFLDVHNVALNLPPLVRGKTLFELEYFTPAEAEEVVRECAGRDALVRLETDFPSAVARDLTKDDGRVRPIELQIVCTALRGTLHLAPYREEGGAAGILSKYIESTVNACSNPKAGRRLLRAACQFAGGVKQKPQTAAEFLKQINMPEVTPEVVRQIVRQFQAARFLVEEKDGAGAGGTPEVHYQLPHDYLVGPIADATRQEVTLSEEADQYLEFYLKQGRGVIPWGRWWMIRRHAGRNNLARPQVRRLMRRSLLANVSRASALVGVVGVLLTVGVFITSTKTWDREVIGYHFPGGRDKAVKLTILREGQGKRPGVMTYYVPSSDGDLISGDAVKCWLIQESINPQSPQMGKVAVERAEGADMAALDESGRYLLYWGSKQPQIAARDLTSRKDDIVLPWERGDYLGSPYRPFVRFDSKGEVVATAARGRDAKITIWAAKAQGVEIGKVFYDPEVGKDLRFVLTASRRLVAYCEDEFVKKAVGLFDWETGKWLGWLSQGKEASFTVDEDKEKVYILEEGPQNGKSRLKSRSLKDGRKIREPVEVVAGPRHAIGKLVGGKYILVPAGKSEASGPLFDVLAPDTLDPFLPQEKKNARLLSTDPPLVCWQAKDGTEVWDLRKDFAERRKLVRLSPEFDVWAVGPNGKKLAVGQPRGGLEIWDLEERSMKPLTPDIKEPIHGMNQSLTGNCLCVFWGPTRARLYDWDSGKLLADLSDVSGDKRVVHYDERARQVYVWSDRGDCVKYTLRWQILGGWRLWRTGTDS